MKAGDDNVTSELDRLNATLSWRGLPAVTGDAQIDAAMTFFRTFAVNFQKLCSESRSVDVNPLQNANDRLAKSMQEFLHCRSPQELIAAKARVLAAMLDAATAQAKLWGDLAVKIQDCCTTMTLATVDQLGSRATSEVSHDRSSELP